MALADLFQRHQSAILQLSGGKDSSALVWLARPWASHITVIFGDTGASFPHVVEHVTRLCERAGMRLEVVRPAEDIRAFHARDGLPADILPVAASGALAPYLAEPPKQLLQSYLRCCGTMLWEPTEAAVRRSGASLVLRGAKASDARRSVPPGTVVDGVEYAAPLWDWSDADVLEYLAREGVELPAHYAAVGDSLDCTICPAHLEHHGIEKLRWIRKHTPELWPEIRDNVVKVRAAVLEHVIAVGAAASVALED
jgi:3'-phosphoadenosine 5'-phosphosulfate sulfotransferase (PAPS reductase)/FAD synthetase